MDPERLKLEQASLAPKQVKRKRVPRHQPGEKFLKGPVPWNWLTRAGQLPGKSLQVGIVLWFLAGLSRNDRVALPNGVLSAFGVNRYAKRRALDRLEEARLIRCDRRSGRSPVVTLLAVGETDETA